MSSTKKASKSSASDSTDDTSSAEVDEKVTFKDIVERDYLRFRNKGVYGLTFSVIATIFLVYAMVELGQLVWPGVKSWVDKNEIPRWKFYIGSTWFVTGCSFFFVNMVYCCIYTMRHPFFEQFKVMKDEQWPWIQDPKAWRVLLWKSIGMVAFNSTVVFLIMNTALMAINKFNIKYSFEIEDLPDKWTIIWQLLFCTYMEDFGFATAHRILHKPWLQAVGISATYAHPIEYAFGNMLPVGIPPMILGPRMHMFTFYVWIVLRITATTNGHSGYEFPWIPWDIFPMRGTPSYHDYHHSGGDFSGNYAGQTTILDTIWGTNKKYYKEYKKAMYEKFYGKKLE